MPDDPLTEDERYPLLPPASRQLLQWLREHPHAPRFNHHCGDRLSADGLARVRAFEAELSAAPRGWRHGEIPPWLEAFAARCFRDVPFYRRYGAQPASFFDIPTSQRADLSAEPWAFVPDDLPLDDLIVYNTSGTTGHPLDILSHPESASKYLPLLQAALDLHGLRLDGGSDPATGRPRVSIVLACFQRRTYTYASLSSYLGGAGFAKVNLNPDDWREPDDRQRFLDDCQPEIYTGDPLSFAELARLPLAHRPKALISTAMQLLPALRRSLEVRFGCPVINLYAMNEAGPIAALTPAGYLPLQHRLYIEILDPSGAPCPPGARGEVVLSGGFNPFIALLRYRTGDWASLHFNGSQPLLRDLEGRPPVVFSAANGQAINNIDVTGRLKPFALPRFSLHQAANGALTLSIPPAADATALRAAMLDLFGQDQELRIVELSHDAPEGKVIQYTRDQA